jgi:phosphoenolpyruvate-protein kinase (PTS system EI component)
LLVNGSEGVVILNPEKKDREIYASKYKADVQQKNALYHLSHKHAGLFANPTINVCANISSPDECVNAAHMECDYVGLFRMEPMLMLFHTFPEEQHLYIQLYKALKPLRDKKIIMRLADLGGDKFLSYITMDMQHNALLGIRGVRFLNKHIRFLSMLLKVIFRLRTAYDIEILIPFVNSKTDVVHIKQVITRLQKDLGDDTKYNTHDVKVGAMIETPIAALSADQIISCTDFISIGTNDLIQYLTAADRESIAVSQYYQEGMSGALHLVKDIIGKTKNQNKRCILCGELAGNMDFSESLLTMGLEHFSVLPPLIPIIKEKIYEYITSKPSN